MKRLKIRGITGMPLFIVRFHGRLDGKRNVVAFKDGKWEGHYLQKKEAIFHSFVHRTYRELEEKTSQLHKESASLAVEYYNILKQLTKPDPIPSGGTNSSQARQKARAATIEPTLRDRKRTIELRMAGIEEELNQNIIEAGAIQREAAALTERRIHAYLHGATLAARAVNFPVEYTVPVLLSNEESYREKHLWNDNVRKSLLKAVLEKNVDSSNNQTTASETGPQNGQTTAAGAEPPNDRTTASETEEES
jgi:hypothetical protein